MSDDFSMYQVGKMYHPNRKDWGEDRTDYNYRSGTHELRMFMRGLREEEINAIATGRAEFAFLVVDWVIFFLFKFPGFPWSDNSYSWHLVPEAERRLPDKENALFIILVDGGTGIVQAMRMIGLPDKFAGKLNEAIRRQAKTPFDAATHDKVIEVAYKRYPTSELMAQEARRLNQHCVMGRE